MCLIQIVFTPLTPLVRGINIAILRKVFILVIAPKFGQHKYLSVVVLMSTQFTLI